MNRLAIFRRLRVNVVARELKISRHCLGTFGHAGTPRMGNALVR